MDHDHAHAHSHAHSHAGHSHGGPGVTERSSPAKHIFRITVAAVTVMLLILYSMYFPVIEGTGVIVERFGNPVRTLTKPGPYFKWPYPIERIRYVNMMKQTFDATFTPTFTHDKRNIMLETFIVWRINDPLQFVRAFPNESDAEAKLDGMVTHAKNYFLGQYDLTALVSKTPSDIKTPEIEKAITDQVNSECQKNKFGIVVEQVGFKRIAYPEQNVKTVLANMRAERKAEAGRIRAEGEKVAQGIRDDANVQREQILKTGREEAGKIRGEAEKEAAQIYAKAHSLDPEFYRFWRSLEALKQTLSKKSTIFLRTDQGFFDVLKPPATQHPKKGARTATGEYQSDWSAKKAAAKASQGSEKKK